ncbi:MAG: 6-phosphofructokinase [Bacteroidota bacterium]|jgi:6-phosphofructokinase 1
MKKIGILTSGGDSPGMNAAIRAVVKTALYKGVVPFGIFDGYLGMIEGRGKELTYADVDTIIQYGGTVLGSARCEEFRTEEGRQKAISYLHQEGVDGLVVIGGDGTYAGASLLSKEMNIPIIGLPGTIDNDIYGTDHTIGFDTALNTVIDAVDKIRDTASSHHRVFFVEVMGRDAGFIALHSAIASGAEYALIPEELTDLEKLAVDIREHSLVRRGTIIIVAEGDDAGNAFEIMNKVRPMLPGFDMRHSVLGHMQRGGSPSVKDRILATRLGNEAVHRLLTGESSIALGMIGDKIMVCPIDQAIKEHAVPDVELLKLLGELHTFGTHKL